MNQVPLIGKEFLNNSFRFGVPEQARIQSGGTAVFDCIDCYGHDVVDETTPYDRASRRWHNAVSGPLYIEGAEPGDCLKVSILSIELPDHGVMAVRPDTGLFQNLITRNVSRKIMVENNEAVFTPQLRIPLRPMIGVIGVACPNELPCTWPGAHGGNLDCKDLTAGASVYLPVYTEGGLLSMGDLHGVQGDGESVICALEMDGRVTVKVEVIKGCGNIPTPMVRTERGSYLVLACAKTLDEASQLAGERALRFVTDYSDFSVEEAGMLLSIHGELRISQVVNPLKGCMMEVPADLVPEFDA